MIHAHPERLSKDQSRVIGVNILILIKIICRGRGNTLEFHKMSSRPQSELEASCFIIKFIRPDRKITAPFAVDKHCKGILSIRRHDTVMAPSRNADIVE